MPFGCAESTRGLHYLSGSKAALGRWFAFLAFPQTSCQVDRKANKAGEPPQRSGSGVVCPPTDI